MSSSGQGQFEDSNWWLAHEMGRSPHEFLVPFIQSMQTKQATRYDNFRRLQNIYEWGYKPAYALQGGSDSIYSSFGQTQDAPLEENILAYNAASNVVNTVHAKITKNKLSIMPLTTGGNYLQQINAKKMGQCIDGELEANRFQRTRKGYTLNGLVQGTGWVKVFKEWGRPRIQRVPPRDIFIDDGEGRYQEPRSIAHRQYVDRFVLKEIYGEKDPSLYGDRDERVTAIMKAPSATDPGGYAAGHDQIQVAEAYHLPSRPIERDEYGKIIPHDGRHTICIDGYTLLDEMWNWERFPFERYAPMPRDESIYGLSMMHQLASGQREFEKYTQTNQLAFERMSGSHIIASRDADCKERDFDNGRGTYIEFSGGIPPVAWNPESVSPQTLQYTAAIPDNMMRFVGISPLSAQSQIPAGLSNASGKALQVYDDFESERLINYHDADEDVMVGVAEMIILVVRDILEEDPDYSVRIRSKDALQSVRWKDAMMDQEDFVLRISPISDLVNTPSAKYQQLQERLNSGDISLDEFNSLIEVPDLQAYDEFATADEDIIKKMLCKIAYDGKYMEPQPFDDLQKAVGLTRKFINMMRLRDDFPDSRMDMLHDFLLSLTDLQKAAMPTAPPPPMPGAPPSGPVPPMPPPGPPMPPS